MNEAPFISLPIYTAAATSTPPPQPPSMFEPINTFEGGPRRNKNPQPPLIIPAGCICFRLLCHASRIGGVIGKSGLIIKQLQQDTTAKIRVEDPPLGSDDRVITVVASSLVNRTLSFDEDHHENNGYEQSSEYREVSAAQEALVRVYERILSVAAEVDGGYFAPGGIVSCRLLAETTLVGSVIGKGGMVVEKIRKDTGCRIRIFGQERLPPCAMPTDELIEIEGDIRTIKNALVAVARRLQDSPSSDKSRIVFSRPHNGVPQEDLPPARTPVQEHAPTIPANPSLGDRFVSMDAESSSVDSRSSQSEQEIAFRLLCPSDRVGGVIGKSGTMIRALQNESGASIMVQDPKSDSEEKLIVITAMESSESRNSPAQNAVILVFNRSVETGYEKGLDSPQSRTQISARLLITPNLIGCLLGKGGSIVADMRKVTGAFIKILGGHHVPRCASETDQVVLMTGEFVNVRDALYSVTGRLRNYILSNRSINGPKTTGTYNRGNNYPPFGLPSSMTAPHDYNQHMTLTQSMDNLRLYNNVDHPSSPRPWQPQTGSGYLIKGQDSHRGSTSVKGGIELGRGNRSAIVTNSTVEILVPENVIGLVYGENGSNLTRLKQISGAKVVVHEPGSGSTDHIVVISGSPDETQSAQSLLQAFILVDQQ